ncbi:hypothetical protein L3X38_040319 [Prunus dulcis]|uniref:Uncharacterized protein n=1 Tax=Prunus dulcis TaxID=3755 RepID=A0AAD4VB18_PRUDU|nr:hypothetical protein L3X38_040319 [Prunus dulcis]
MACLKKKKHSSTAALHSSFVHFFLVFSLLIACVAVQAFTGTYGINYGRIADNIPSPDKVVSLIRAGQQR